MAKQLYINFNGSYFKEDEPIFNVKNRGFRYGDALFESIRVINGKPCFIEDHFFRLKRGMETLKLRPGKISFNDLKGQIEELLEKNGVTKGGRVRLSVFRSGEGLYAPENDDKSYVIEAKPIDDNEYVLNEVGLNVDTYNDVKMYRNSLSQIKTTNSIPNVLAGIYKNENGLDECILLNDAGRIAETISSNIFLYKNNNLYTPSLDEGCMDGVMRKQILRVAKDLNLNVFEGMLNGTMLLQADEMFLTNAIYGIQWVASYRQKRYFNKASKEILDYINTLTCK